MHSWVLVDRFSLQIPARVPVAATEGATPGLHPVIRVAAIPRPGRPARVGAGAGFNVGAGAIPVAVVVPVVAGLHSLVGLYVAVVVLAVTRLPGEQDLARADAAPTTNDALLGARSAYPPALHPGRPGAAVVGLSRSAPRARLFAIGSDRLLPPRLAVICRVLAIVRLLGRRTLFEWGRLGPVPRTPLDWRLLPDGTFGWLGLSAGATFRWRCRA